MPSSPPLRILGMPQSAIHLLHYCARLRVACHLVLTRHCAHRACRVRDDAGAEGQRARLPPGLFYPATLPSPLLLAVHSRACGVPSRHSIWVQTWPGPRAICRVSLRAAHATPTMPNLLYATSRAFGHARTHYTTCTYAHHHHCHRAPHPSLHCTARACYHAHALFAPLRAHRAHSATLHLPTARAKSALPACARLDVVSAGSVWHGGFHTC